MQPRRRRQRHEDRAEGFLDLAASRCANKYTPVRRSPSIQPPTRKSDQTARPRASYSLLLWSAVETHHIATGIGAIASGRTSQRRGLSSCAATVPASAAKAMASQKISTRSFRALPREVVPEGPRNEETGSAEQPDHPAGEREQDEEPEDGCPFSLDVPY